jgi:hypothetical protein
MTNKMQMCTIIYYSLAALHVSGDIFAHHREHLNCITASDITHVCRCRLVSWECSTLQWYQPAATYVCKSRSSLDAPDDERKYCLKHVEQPRNNKLSYTFASCWSFSCIVSWCTETWISNHLIFLGDYKTLWEGCLFKYYKYYCVLECGILSVFFPSYVYWPFEATYLSTLKVEVAWSSESPIHFY